VARANIKIAALRKYGNGEIVVEVCGEVVGGGIGASPPRGFPRGGGGKENWGIVKDRTIAGSRLTRVKDM
jgi:hypothetical protein